ncbi:MAG TPA: valine--tRNA ligase [Armatimonadota bacterium]|nr:valine--tRNA ligase [Armatimonadota bacterium]
MDASQLPKTYDPHAVEAKWYRFWDERGYFHAEADSGKPRYCITIPPPNVTGELHLGHALCYEVQDILGRYHRMTGKQTLILPGTDHAGIATQNVVERQLAQEGVTRYELGREGFLQRVWQWKDAYGRRIEEQFRALGFAFDWGRDRFTMDPAYSDAVLEAFVRLFDEGYIYRGERVTNWCPRCRTAISDIEVEHQESPGHLYHIAYPYATREGAVVVATTRPETMLGDTAVAVNPTDERYRDVVGERVILPLVEREIPIIADHYADPEFGTGAVKVTPAHDLNDFEAGERHGLPRVKVIGDDGCMTADAGRFAGMDRFAAREAVVAALREDGRLVEVEPYAVSLAACERCGTVLEPLLSEQWFVRMKELALPAIEVVESGRVRFVPERWADVYLEWMRNIRDWCISRQLWWGHRIPVYTCGCGRVVAAKSAPERCPACGGPSTSSGPPLRCEGGPSRAASRGGAMTQDPDVLDTWFSSALWPFATLGWPRQTPELECFYPTNLMVTSSQIIFLWVARMVMMGLHFMGDIPYPEVYINATVLNAQGRRMSKSLGTGVDPLETVEKYGADATRFGLIAQSSGQQVRFEMERVETGRNLCNKLWNAARMVRMNLDEAAYERARVAQAPSPVSLADRWILSRLEATTQTVTQALGDYRADEAARALYDFFWGELCDWYLEIAKPALRGDDPAARTRTQDVLIYTFERTLRLLHPFMPFITEELWQALPHDGESIMIAPWPVLSGVEGPEGRALLRDQQAEEAMSLVMAVVTSARRLRIERGVEPGAAVEIILTPDSKRATEALTAGQAMIAHLVHASSITLGEPAGDAEVATDVIPWEGEQVRVSVSTVASAEELARERDRLQKELVTLEAELARTRGRLDNANFIARASEKVVAETRARIEDAERRAVALRERMAALASRLGG